ncbi:hypothetical protein Syun_024582 [Stephania yunnanensis]|uniref:Uncharacterized protein n=1 Tax=Stephania yunnanensis TaxID=152371 RepID=A0AAP0I4P2_9MAGN
MERVQQLSPVMLNTSIYVESYYNSQCVDDVEVMALGYVLGKGGGGLGDFAEEDDGGDDYNRDDGEHEEEA